MEVRVSAADVGGVVERGGGGFWAGLEGYLRGVVGVEVMGLRVRRVGCEGLGCGEGRVWVGEGVGVRGFVGGLVEEAGRGVGGEGGEV